MKCDGVNIDDIEVYLPIYKDYSRVRIINFYVMSKENIY